MLKKEVIKMLKKLRAIIRDVDHWPKDLESIKRSQSKSDNSITKMRNRAKDSKRVIK